MKSSFRILKRIFEVTGIGDTFIVTVAGGIVSGVRETVGARKSVTFTP